MKRDMNSETSRRDFARLCINLYKAHQRVVMRCLLVRLITGLYLQINKNEVLKMADIKETIGTLREKIVAEINEYNKALKENDFAKATRIEQGLKEVEAHYAEAKSVEVFNELEKSANPVKAAITMYSYPVVAHRPKRDDGVVTGFEVVDDKVHQIDLVKFCQFCNLPIAWQYKVEKFNQLLALRAANELKMTKTQIQKICDSFYMNDLARQIDMGETPDSNTAICKQLQQVLDSILFEDNGKGKNLYRANNHDVAYLLMCYTKRGKKPLSVSVAKNAYMHRLVLDVAHRIVTGKTYDLEYRMVSDTKSTRTKTRGEVKKTDGKTEAELVNTVNVKESA
jgi:hypothetical protein